MPTVNANGVDIAYDWQGPEGGPVMLLVMGLGLPSSAWPPDFVERLTGAGFGVLTFDNRDSGRSQILDDLAVPSLGLQLIRRLLRLPIRAPYQINDMVADAAALLDALALDRVHVVGASMGGMIAQSLALQRPSQVVSLTSLMSTTNNRRLPLPHKHVLRYVLKRNKALSQDSLRRYHEGFWPLIQSPAHPHTEDELRAFLDRLFERGMSAIGGQRQALAIAACPDRTQALAELRVPTLVIHGDADPLLPVEHGYATAAAIKDAEILIYEGMGHDLPPALLAPLADAIIGHARVCGAGAETALAS